MKTLSVTITLLQFFLTLKSQFACARGKFALYESCLASNIAPFMRDEMTLVMESAASTKTALANPSPDTNRFVRWMFGTSTASYDPYAAPRAITGGTGTGEDDIIGLAGLTGEVPVDATAGGDVVSCGVGWFCFSLSLANCPLTALEQGLGDKADLIQDHLLWHEPHGSCKKRSRRCVGVVRYM